MDPHKFAWDLLLVGDTSIYKEFTSQIKREGNRTPMKTNMTLENHHFQFSI